MMLAANELRLGNLVTLFGKPYEIGSINHKGRIYFIGSENRPEDVKDLEGIPITEEWLDKIEQATKHSDRFWSINGFQVYFDEQVGFHRVIDGIVIKFAFVHQLQNMFYAVHYKELTIKE